MTSATLNTLVTLSTGYEEGAVPPHPVDATMPMMPPYYPVAGEWSNYAWAALNGASDPSDPGHVYSAMEHKHHTTPFKTRLLLFTEDNHFQVRLCTSITPLRNSLLVLPVNHMESKVTRLLARCIDEAVDEVFMDGMDSTFSLRVTSLVIKYDNAAVSALDHLLNTGEVNAEVSGEVLRVLGSLHNDKSYFSRLRLLLEQLKSTDPRIRDAASLGLASLDEPMSLSALRKAHAMEKSELVQRNIGLVIEQLERA